MADQMLVEPVAQPPPQPRVSSAEVLAEAFAKTKTVLYRPLTYMASGHDLKIEVHGFNGALVDTKVLKTTLPDVPLDVKAVKNVAQVHEIELEEAALFVRCMLVDPRRSIQALSGISMYVVPDHLSAYAALFDALGGEEMPLRLSGANAQELMYSHLCYLAGIASTAPSLLMEWGSPLKTRTIVPCGGGMYLRALRVVLVEQTVPCSVDPTHTPEMHVMWKPVLRDGRVGTMGVFVVDSYDAQLDVLIGHVTMLPLASNLAAMLNGAVSVDSTLPLELIRLRWLQTATTSRAVNERQLVVRRCFEAIRQRSSARGVATVDTHGWIKTPLTLEQAASIADMRAIRRKDLCHYLFFSVPSVNGRMLTAEYPRGPGDRDCQPVDIYTHLPVGVISSPKGSGKTLLTLSYIFAMQLRAVIIVPAQLAIHWLRECEKHINGFKQLCAQGYIYIKSPRSKLGRIGPDTRLAIVGASSVASTAIEAMGPHVMFIDEAHLVNRRAKYTTKLAKLSNTREIWTITATPAGGFANVSDLLRVPLIAAATGRRIVEQDVAMALSTFFTVSYVTKLPCEVVSSTIEVSGATEQKFWSAVYQTLSGARLANLGTAQSAKVLKLLLRCTFSGIIDVEATITLLKRMIGGVGAGDAAGAPGPVFDEGLAEAVAIGVIASDDCPVCLDTFSDPYQLDCRHVLCRECLSSVASMHRPKCPNCRSVMPRRVYKARWAEEEKIDAMVVAPVVVKESGTDVFSAKADALHTLLVAEMKRDGRVRAVVFVSSTHSREMCVRVLTGLDLTYRLAGFRSSYDVAGIEEFRDNREINVLLAHQRVGVGHDLNTASLVCIMDVTPDVAGTDQAAGRLTRLSQVNPIIRLVKLVTVGGLDYALDRMITTGLPVGLNKASLAMFPIIVRPLNGACESVDQVLAHGLLTGRVRLSYPHVIVGHGANQVHLYLDDFATYANNLRSARQFLAAL